MEERTKETIPNPSVVFMAVATGLAGVAAGGLICVWTVMALPPFMRFVASGLDVLNATQADVLGKSILTMSPVLFLLVGIALGSYVGIRAVVLITTAMGWVNDAIRPDWRWLRVERKRLPSKAKKDEPKGGQPA